MLILQKMVSLFLLMIAGLFLKKKGWASPEGTTLLTKIIINIANPAMIISAGLSSNTSLSNQILLVTMEAAIIFYSLVIVFAPVLVRLIHVEVKDRGTYEIMFVFGNIGYMGLPLITSVYGSDAALLLSIFNFFYTVLMYTYGIMLFTNSAKKDPHEKTFHFMKELKNILNPGTIGCVIALSLFLLHLNVPSFISDTVSMLGNLAAPLSMFVIGFSLADIRPIELIGNSRLNIFILIRLLLLPLIGISISRLLTDNDMIIRVVYIVCSVPIGSLTAIMAGEYGGNKDLAAKGVALSTVLSVITVPLIGILMGL